MLADIFTEVLAYRQAGARAFQASHEQALAAMHAATGLYNAQLGMNNTIFGVRMLMETGFCKSCGAPRERGRYRCSYCTTFYEA